MALSKGKSALAVSLLLLAGCTGTNTPSVGATVGASASAIAPSVAALYNTCSKATDLNCGNPNTSCATSRLGKQFVKNNVVYRCQGPKPYKWRQL